VDQYDELASIKREERREEKARRKSIRRASRLGQATEGGLHSFQEEGEEEEEVGVGLERMASGDRSEDSDEPATETSFPDGQKKVSSKRRRASVRRRSSVKPSAPGGRRSSAASKSPRKGSVSQSSGTRGGSDKEGEGPQSADSAAGNASPGRRLTRMRSASSHSGDISPRSARSVEDKHVQTDVQATEQDKNAMLQHDLQDKKETILSMENHIFSLNTNICELKLKVEEQVLCVC
jgi:hypothetical protein